MSGETPKGQRKRSPCIENANTILVRYTLQALPPDAFPDRVRKGRPERSPSLPPVEEQKSTDDPPPSV